VTFEEWSPCVYQGKIDCKDCPIDQADQTDGCDMRAGRELDKEAFEAGAQSAAAYVLEDDRRIALLYRMARLARNTDGLHPSTAGPAMGALLLELRLIDGERYAREVM